MTPGTHGMCVHTAVADVLWDQPHRLPPIRTLAKYGDQLWSTIEDSTTFSIQSHTLCPLAFLVLAFVLVWLVAWVGFVVAPPPVLAIGSALGDASGVFLVPVLALLRFAFDRASKSTGVSNLV